MDWTWIIVVAATVLVAIRFFTRQKSEPSPEPLAKFHIGDVTQETLQQYAGYDYSKPILVAIRGKVYDVTDAADQYAPGKPLQAYAGKEIARALAKGSSAEEDLGSEAIHDLNQEAAERLQAAIASFDNQFNVVGQVVPMRELTLQELAQYDGVGKPNGPLYLAIEGQVFDVSKGSQFYGPDGVYPFAGKECARALALMSTELSDCNDRTEDLGYVEKENLREWKAKFNYKYPIVGKIVGPRPAVADPPATAAVESN